jgi:astacin
MAWQYNKKVLATYATSGAQWSWANLDGGTGWKRIKGGQADGVTNLTVLINCAHAHGRSVHVDIDTAGLITTAYMI